MKVEMIDRDYWINQYKIYKNVRKQEKMLEDWKQRNNPRYLKFLKRNGLLVNE